MDAIDSIKSLTEVIHPGVRTIFDLSKVGDAKTITVERRQLNPEDPRPPIRFESPAREHVFLAAESLAAYLTRYGSKDTVVYADPAGECVFAVVNERADKGFEVVVMEPQVHPLWKPWADLAGKRVALKDFAAFVAQHRRSVFRPVGRDLALTLAQVRASVRVEIQTGRGRNAVNGIMVTSEVSGGTRQTEPLDVPDEIVLKVPLYVQTEAREVALDLCIEPASDGMVSVIVTAGTVAEARVAAFEEMVATIQAGIEQLGATLTYGRPKHTGWKYLDEAVES